ncbi:MAG: hypothetical protein Q9184_001695 [Pyrenodesmia sp. 2 TL-2023]
MPRNSFRNKALATVANCLTGAHLSGRYAIDVDMANDRYTTKLETSTSGDKGLDGICNPEDTADIVGNRSQAAAIDFPTKAQEILHHVLQWLSTASNETLGACLAGLGAITYLVLGRVGLVLMGIVGGVALHATWEENFDQFGAQAGSAEEKAQRKREDGLNILHRVLDWRGAGSSPDADVNRSVDDVPFKLTADKQLNFSQFEPATGAALTGLTDAVIGNYVKWWYAPILPEDLSFPSACRQVLTGFLLSISSHLSRKRPADVFLNFLTNSSSVIIVFLNELAAALTVSTSTEDGVADAVHQYLEQNPSSSLSNILDLDQQRKKLKEMSDDILQAFLDQRAYQCEPVRTFLRQILAGVCLEMTVQSCSRPEWINGWIVYLLEQDEPQLINAFDAGVGNTTSDQPGATSASCLDEQGQPMSHTDDSAFVEHSGHRRTVSRAEEAMDEAMQEAKRLSEMIAAEEAKRVQGKEDLGSSGTTTADGPTPTSSQSDLGALTNGSTPSFGGEIMEYMQAQQPPVPEPASTFTNFDQILSSKAPTALQPGHVRTQSVIPSLTLHNASISIFDDAMPGDKGTVRSKPTVDYLLQVEPPTPQHPGWMIARKYADFETLHEVLKRISVISGVPEFADRHSNIPAWKNRSKEALRADLERYLRDALSYSRLAESEGMKRFLEKDQGLGKSSPNVKQGGFGFPTPATFETMGKGMLDVLSSAPKGAAGGGKAILGGVSGVLGGVSSLGQKKQAPIGNNKSAQSSNAQLARTETNRSWAADAQLDRGSQDFPRTSFNENNRPKTQPKQPARESNGDHDTYDASNFAPSDQADLPAKSDGLLTKSVSDLHSPINDRSDEDSLHLPPPPSEIPDDWSTSPLPQRKSTSTDDPKSQPSSPLASISRAKVPKPPLTEPETRVAIELFFATITSLYTLSSSVWAIRRTLLLAAKNFLLRPGNPNLEAIRVLIQDTVIDANISDSGLASHIHKIRENALPTEAELKNWPSPMGEEEKGRLRNKARSLLIEKGMPQALTSVMGQAASGEAVGRVFDALQVEEVARGVMFALILQGVRAVTQ